jgi:hypothetical protein
VGVELFGANGQIKTQTDGQTEMTQLIVDFRNCLNACLKSLFPLMYICVLKITVLLIADSAKTKIQFSSQEVKLDSCEGMHKIES